jgi:hypothetical protein
MSGATTSWQSGPGDGRSLKILTLIDEYTRECLAIHVDRQIKSVWVMEKRRRFSYQSRTPEYLGLDNESEFASPEI